MRNGSPAGAAAQLDVGGWFCLAFSRFAAIVS